VNRSPSHWLIYLYVIASVILTCGTLLHGEVRSALCLFGTSFISLVAAGGFKFGLLWGDNQQRIGVPLVALVLFALAYWLSAGFGVQIFGYHFSGLEWGALGAAIGIVFIDKRMASARREASPQQLDAVNPLFAQVQGEAEQGNPQSQYRLANAYYNGRGVTRSSTEGARWLLKAAEQGHVQAQCDLGVMYQNGFGVEQSYRDALNWYRRAAEQGDALAQHNLGSLNAKGFRPKGTRFFDRTAFIFMRATQDWVEAYKWFSLAAANGHNRSLKDRAIIKRRMSAIQIAMAESLINEWERGRSGQAPHASDAQSSGI
jgi:hypothetical protein